MANKAAVLDLTAIYESDADTLRTVRDMLAAIVSVIDERLLS